MRIKTQWEVWTYDVWGNPEDGFNVNDRYKEYNDYEISLRVDTFNKDTPFEFQAATPSDYQLKKLFGFTGRIDTEGDDVHIYVNKAHNLYPLGELYCISHKSLSPIGEKVLVI